MVQKTRLKGIRIAGVLGICLGIAGCGSKNKRAKPKPPPATELARADVLHLRETDHPGYREFDQENDQLFTLVFGGTEVADVTKYLDTRLRYYFDRDDQVSTVSSSTGNVRTIAEIYAGKSDANAENSEVGAVNAGLELWLNSIVNSTNLHLNHPGGSTPITSSRVGITILGPGYRTTFNTPQGPVTLHPTFRQAILIHEARHSDCTGGISGEWVRSVRARGNTSESNDSLDGLECGHTHVMCPDDHEYAGKYACDMEPWGAYTISNVFYRAVSREFEIGSVDYQLATMFIADFESRVLVPRGNTLPDMSSSGYQP